MGQLLENLKRYFDETPEEVIKSDMEQLEYLNNIGPDVFEYAESAKRYFYNDSPLPHQDFDNKKEEIFEAIENNTYYLAA